MKDKRSAVRPILSLLILFAMLGAALAESSPALAQDGAPEITPTPTLTATPTETPTVETAAAQGEAAPGDTPTAEPETPATPEPPADTPAEAPAETPENTPTQPTDPTGTPEEVSAEALDTTPTATQGAEIVPLVMPEDTSNIIPGQYIVVYKKGRGDSKTLKAGRDKAKEKGGEIKASYSAAIKGFSAKLNAEALHELRQDPDIAFIEPDQYIYATEDEIVPLATRDVTAGGLWGLDRIDQLELPLDGYYHYPSSAGAGVHVYILDSGILTSHEQFEGRASNDYDLINDGRTESQYFYHGTAVASVVGGKDYGVAKDVYLHSVRVLNYQGSGSFSNVISGLNWVINNHSDPAVVNMSLGDDSISSSLLTAVANTDAAGITVVVSSGNVSSDNPKPDACDWSPASAPLALTVGATTIYDSRDTSYSTYGACLDLFAPGTNILCADNSNDTDYDYRSGTSLAAPMVAGAAALYLSDNPAATPAEVRTAILDQATAGILENVGEGSPNLLLAVFTNEVPQVTLASPADAAEINQTTVTLAWNAGFIGNTYELQVDDSASFDSLFFTTSTESLNAEVESLTAGTWYWRVQATNAYGAAGDWSATRSFTVDLTAPDAPLLSSPADNTFYVGTPAFAWGAVDTAAYYQFQYNTSSDPDTGLVHRSAELTNRSYTPPTMEREEQYYWFARARDAAGNWSAWSSPFRIMSVPAGPAAPALSSPSNGAYLNDDTPAFSWAEVAAALGGYNIQIAENSSFSPVLESADELMDESYTAGPLEEIKYYWHVRSKSQYGIYGGWSSIRYFVIDKTSPEAPSLISPVSGARTVGEPMFAWGAVSGATAYQLALSLTDNLKGTNSEDYVYISDELSVTSHTPSIKNKNATYYWNVRARDAAGNWSFWSNSNFLTIVADTPAQVSLADPLSGKLLNDNTPTLSWKLLADSEYYHLQIAASSAFTTPVIDEDGLTGTSYTVEVADALADGTYYWRVRGRNNSSDYGAWSSARYFKVDTIAPDAPLALYPLDDAAVIDTPTFKWSRPASAKYYQLRYADADAPETILYTSGEITAYYLKPPAMDVMNTYLWSARTIDAAGNPSDWSTPVSVTILPPTPGRPVLSAPASATVINPDLTSLQLAWNSAAYAHRYHIQVSTRTSFTAPYLVKEETAWDGLSYTPADLAESTYYWRVRAINENGTAGSWSGVRYFRVDETEPDAPVLYSPKSNTQVTGTPTFQWLRAGDALTFEFAYNTSDDPETALYTSGVISRTAVKPPAMDTGTLFYWFVRAYDKAGNQSDWSAANTVTILAPKPASPVLSLPATASMLANPTPELSWSAVDYGEYYDVQLSTSSGFSPLSREATDLDVLTYMPAALPEARYYWRVRAKNENGTAGAWSSTRYFTVDTSAPAAPLLRAPTDGASITGWPTLSWNAASGARYYQVAYGTLNDPDAAEFTSDWITATYLKVTGMDLNTPYYWFVRSKDYAGNISENWSAARQLTVKPSNPLRVNLSSPASGTATDDATVELGWSAVSFGNTYEVQVDDSSYFSSVNYSYTSAEEALTLTTGELAPGKWYWRARACNVDGICGSWSYARSLIIYGKFDTQFETEGDSQGWAAASGASWAAAAGALSTDGLTGGHSSSAAYDDMIFTDFTYEAVMKMDAPPSGEANTYGLVLRGTPAFDAWNDWTKGVYFTIRQVNDGTAQYACALAYKIVSGKWGYLGGSCGEALYNDWNSLTVYAKGTTWKFYVNDSLVLSAAISGISSGQLGVVGWSQSAAGADMDEANAGAPVIPEAVGLALSAQSAPAVDVDPRQVFEAMKK